MSGDGAAARARPARRARTSRGLGRRARSRPITGSMRRRAGRISPAMHAGPQLVREVAPADAACAGKVEPKAARGEVDRAASELFDPESALTAGASSPRASAEPGATTTFEPRGSGGSAAPERRAVARCEPDAPACARSSKPSRRGRPRCASRTRRGGVALVVELVAAEEVQPSGVVGHLELRRGHARAGRARPAASPRLPASSGCERISWKSTAAHPSARITSSSPSGTGRAGLAAPRPAVSAARSSSAVRLRVRSVEREGPLLVAQARGGRERSVDGDEAAQRGASGRPGGDHAALARAEPESKPVPWGVARERSQQPPDPAVRVGRRRLVFRSPRARPGSGARSRPAAERSARTASRTAASSAPGNVRRSAPPARPPAGADAVLAADREVADLAVAPRERGFRSLSPKTSAISPAREASGSSQREIGGFVPVHASCSVITSAPDHGPGGHAEGFRRRKDGPGTRLAQAVRRKERPARCGRRSSPRWRPSPRRSARSTRRPAG